MAFDTRILYEKNRLWQKMLQLEVEMLKYSKQGNDAEVNKCLEKYKEIREELNNLKEEKSEDL